MQSEQLRWILQRSMLSPGKGLNLRCCRPVPLEMQFIGVTAKAIFEARNVMDEVCYKKASPFSTATAKIAGIAIGILYARGSDHVHLFTSAANPEHVQPSPARSSRSSSQSCL